MSGFEIRSKENCDSSQIALTFTNLRLLDEKTSKYRTNSSSKDRAQSSDCIMTPVRQSNQDESKSELVVESLSPLKSRLEEDKGIRTFSEAHVKKRESLIRSMKQTFDIKTFRRDDSKEYMELNIGVDVVNTIKDRLVETGMEVFADTTERFKAKYKVLELIGEGNNAVVKKCLNRETSEMLAVKIIRTNDIEELKAIKNEFLIHRTMRHPNVVKAYEMYYNPIKSCVQIVMELIEGKELFDIIKSKVVFTGNFLFNK